MRGRRSVTVCVSTAGAKAGNIRIEYRWVDDNPARLPEVAAELVRLKPDVIATRGSFFTEALKTATSSIPIVFLNHADPVGTGHVASLARPGGNITGTALLQTEIGIKNLELLHTVVSHCRPDCRSLAYRHAVRHSRAQSTVEPARRVRVQLQPVGVRSEAELASAFSDDDPRRREGRARVEYDAVDSVEKASRRARDSASAPSDVPGQALRRGRWAHELLPEARGPMAASEWPRGQDPEGRESRASFPWSKP